MPDDELLDPFLGLAVTVSQVHPFQATKEYLCPGCNSEIAARVGHVVVVPVEAADLRRHWHTSCWNRRPKGRRR